VIVMAVVQVPAKVADELARFAEAGRDRVRTRDGLRMSAPCEQLIAELQAVARVARLDLAATRPEDDPSCTLHSMTAAEYARRNNVTSQAVTERCRRGTLPGAHKVAGKWFIYKKGDRNE
jgi:hypothetical protein